MSTRRKFSARLLTGAVLFALAGIGRANTPTTPAPRAAEAVRRELALSAAPHVELLDSVLQGNRLSLNFSRAVLDLTPGSLAFEEWSRGVHVAAADTLREEHGDFEIHTLIAGVPLNQILAANEQPRLAPQFALPPATAEPARAALVARRIAISPGHGYYLNSSSRWVLQRDFYSGIVEDFVNHDFVAQLGTLLAAAGADVRPTRNLDRAAGDGESGFPKWQEAARYHAKALGTDPSVWNESGFDHLSQDIRCRPLYANAIGAELLVSVHNNGGGGTGTETLYDTNNGFGAESKRLADTLHARVIAAIRRDYDPAWTDRRVQGFNGSYGENRLATRPAVIMEIAFMDRPTPDNVALRDERFKTIVATAIRDGIGEFLDGPGALAPAVPTALLASADSTAVTLAWTDNANSETGFRVERRAAASTTWSLLATLAANTTTHRDATASFGTSYLYRVQAFNAVGNSVVFSNEATARLAPPNATLVITNFTPAAPPTLGWGQEAVFTFTVVDGAGNPAVAAAISVRDELRNAPIGGETDASGRFTHRSIVPAGQTNATYAIEFRATKPGYVSSARTDSTIIVNQGGTAAGAPSIRIHPPTQTVALGRPVDMGVAATSSWPLRYQWRFNGADLAGSTNAFHSIGAATAADAGRYGVVVSTSAGSVTSLDGTLTLVPATWLANVSLRTTLAAGQNVIVGFVVSGGAKEILLRAAGPALAPFGLPAAMNDPRLELFRGPVRLADNNDWPAALAPAMAAVGAFPFSAASRDAALLQSLAGPHTTQVSGTAAGTVLVEGYDAGRGSATRLINLSARNRVGTGGDILIAGFFVAGTGTQRLLIRAVGPALAGFGVTGALADPRLELYDATARIAENDNWDATLAPVFAQVGAFPLPSGSRDSALVIALPANRAYTAQVSGVGGTTGEALVEVYEVP